MDIELIQGGVQMVPHTMLTLSGLSHLLSDNLWIAQQYQDNLGSNVGQAWENFIKTGQIWALMIGFALGYIFRSLTSY